MNSIVIVAGGKGLRMGHDIPKQFLLLNNKPILMHTIEKFHSWDSNCEIILVLPKFQHDYWSSVCEKQQFNIPLKITTGGDTRFHSVKNGLNVATGNIIGIHDGVRPLVSHDTISLCFNTAKEKGNAVPCIPVNDSLRKEENNSNNMVDRSLFFRIQTPQVFQSDIIKRAFNQPFSKNFTDDASVIESDGETVILVEGNEENIKITRPIDLKIASVFI
jgi:2-C-methyl-D-erythritol 4-phosphate cytidylyltransferase